VEIYLDTVKEEGIQWEGDISLDLVRLEVDSKKEFTARTEISLLPVKSYFQLKGKIAGEIDLNCTRCLEIYKHTYDFPFELYIAREPLEGSTEEIELNNKDLKFSFNHGEYINLMDIITEQLALSLPMKLLCRNSCKGLCAGCGANLNKQDCSCEKKGFKSNHPFAALAGMKDKKEN
jgi:uncharacterized protein